MIGLQVLHQSYWAPQDIKTMAITSTRKGITSKQILVGTDNGQVSQATSIAVDQFRSTTVFPVVHDQGILESLHFL